MHILCHGGSVKVGVKPKLNFSEKKKNRACSYYMLSTKSNFFLNLFIFWNSNSIRKMSLLDKLVSKCLLSL